MSPAAPATAEAQLLRLLWLIPAAARPGGVSLEDAAERLGVSVTQLHKDVRALTEREFYLPAGAAEGLQISLTDRLEVHDRGIFTRPPRLTQRELLCVLLALRQGPDPDPELVGKLEGKLAFPSGKKAGGGGAGEAVPISLPDLEEPPRPDAARAVLRRGWRERRPCVFGYLKPDAPAPELRRLHCWALVHAEGRWYACGLDPDAGEPRYFRVDRILEARLEGEAGAYEIPDDFDPSEVLDGARVFRIPGEAAGAGDSAGDDATGPADVPHVTVRYAPSVAPWVREQWAGEPDGNGGYEVRHPVGDPGWVIRHVLQYGPEAEVVAPEEMRAAVRGVVEGMG